MKNIQNIIAVGVVLAGFLTTPANAASLLGGLVNTGADSGNSGGLVSANDNGSIGVGGSGGVSVNLGGLSGGSDSGSSGGSGGLVGSLGGGSAGGTGGILGSRSGGAGSLVNGLTGGTGQLDVGNVASVSGASSDGLVPNVGVSLLGGGGLSANTGSLPILGGGVGVNLPGLGGLTGTNGTTGANGTNGTTRVIVIGNNGLPGASGTNGSNGYNGRNGNSVAIPVNITSRLRQILAMLAARDWIRMVNGRAICLANFGVAEISSALPQKDWAGLNAALPQYAQDIATLRQLLANCRSSAQRQALNVRDLNRVIGIDIARNGMPVLYML